MLRKGLPFPTKMVVAQGSFSRLSYYGNSGNQWNIHDINWEKGRINGSDMEQIVDMFRKQLSELTKKHSILQERSEELKQAAFKKEERFSDQQESAKSKDELQLVKVRN